MRVFLVVTNQQSIGAFECQRLMREVNEFRARARDGWDGGPLEVLVTGRSAYVAEISLSMRHDIVATLLGSVSAGRHHFFRRFSPLDSTSRNGIFAFVLVPRRAGARPSDFRTTEHGDRGILRHPRRAWRRFRHPDIWPVPTGARPTAIRIHRRIATAVQKLGRAVFFGALTTAVGFLALVLSGSIGFSQLGVLIAIGILFAGLFMCTIFFLFVRERQAPCGHDWIFNLVKRYVGWSVRRPTTILICSTVILSILSVFGFSPRPALPFDSSARSLEPKNSRAGQALAAIMSKMPTRWEPVLAIVRGPDAQQLHDDWQKVAAHWSDLQAAGKIKGFSTPAALALSPMSIEQNRERLQTIDFASVRVDLTKRA